MYILTTFYARKIYLVVNSTANYATKLFISIWAVDLHSYVFWWKIFRTLFIFMASMTSFWWRLTGYMTSSYLSLFIDEQPIVTFLRSLKMYTLVSFAHISARIWKLRNLYKFKFILSSKHPAFKIYKNNSFIMTFKHTYH